MSAGGAEPVFRRAISFFLAGCCLHASVQAACGNIVVMSSDAQYMVLAPDTLRTLEVGSLWWLGIFNGIPVDGSSYEYAIFSSDYFVDLAANRYMMGGMEVQRVFWNDAPYGWIALEKMGKNVRTQWDLGFIERTNWGGFSEVRISPQFSPGVAIWTIGHVAGYDVIQLVDRKLRVIQTWEDPRLTVNLEAGFCPDGNLLYFIGGDRAAQRQVRIMLNSADISALPLRVWERGRYGTTKIDPYSCVAMATKGVEDDNWAMDDIHFDFRDQNIISTGQRYRYGSIFYFNHGANILRRHTEPTANFGRVHTDRFLTLDTENLSIVKDVSLDAEGAYLSGELICEPETPRAVLMGQGKIGLVDPNDLNAITWKKLPWEFFTVFE